MSDLTRITSDLIVEVRDLKGRVDALEERLDSKVVEPVEPVNDGPAEIIKRLDEALTYERGVTGKLLIDLREMTTRAETAEEKCRTLETLRISYKDLNKKAMKAERDATYYRENYRELEERLEAAGTQIEGLQERLKDCQSRLDRVLKMTNGLVLEE